MPIADISSYLQPIRDELVKKTPDNRHVNIVCHGHSVPSGAFTDVCMEPFSAYPHLTHRILHKRYPYSQMNFIVTAKPWEHSISGQARFEKDVMGCSPDLLTIDYALNDRWQDQEQVESAWCAMIERCIEKSVKVILFTPSADISNGEPLETNKQFHEQADRVRALAEKFEIGLVDSTKLYMDYLERHGSVMDILSQTNHPNHEGHELIAKQFARWFMMP